MQIYHQYKKNINFLNFIFSIKLRKQSNLTHNLHEMLKLFIILFLSVITFIFTLFSIIATIYTIMFVIRFIKNFPENFPRFKKGIVFKLDITKESLLIKYEPVKIMQDVRSNISLIKRYIVSSDMNPSIIKYKTSKGFYDLCKFNVELSKVDAKDIYTYFLTITTDDKTKSQ